jgi:hypothetical protein
MTSKTLRFTPVEEETPPAPAHEDDGAAIKMMMLALGALSKRAVVALESLFTAAAVASAWALWYGVEKDPNPLQLVWLGMYAAFILAVEFVRRKK